jgi:hypothetical protein
VDEDVEGEAKMGRSDFVDAIFGTFLLLWFGFNSLKLSFLLLYTLNIIDLILFAYIRRRKKKLIYE